MYSRWIKDRFNEMEDIIEPLRMPYDTETLDQQIIYYGD